MLSCQLNWIKAREDLKAIVHHVGPPTFLFPFPSADMHWPELHALFTDWFFTQRLENFIKHWDRFKYQAKGSIHCHGVAKLKNDPGLCNLEKALKGNLAEKSLKNG